MDEFLWVPNWKTAKQIWDTLEVTYEGTEEVKRSKLNSLSQEYKLFKMIPHESNIDFQNRLTHLTNYLMKFEKIFTNDDLNLKFLRSLYRVWHPKVIVI